VNTVANLDQTFIEHVTCCQKQTYEQCFGSVLACFAGMSHDDLKGRLDTKSLDKLEAACVALLSSRAGRPHMTRAMEHSLAASSGESGVATNSAEQPAPRDSATGSVEQPAHPTSFKTLADVRHWLDNLSGPDRSAAPVCRVREALRVLELEGSRDGRRQLQSLLKSWGIKQKESSNKKRCAPDVHQRLAAAVFAEGNRLRQC